MKPENLKLWVYPSHYFGAEWPEYYVVAGRSRDSGVLERSNWDAIVEALGGESKRTNGVVISRASHWACGWVETLLIHRGASKKLAIADRIAEGLESYPIVDEELFSRYEDEERQSIWEMEPLKYRIAMCVKAGLSMFAARSESYPCELCDAIEVQL